MDQDVGKSLENLGCLWFIIVCHISQVSVCDLTNFEGNQTSEVSHCNSEEDIVDPQALVNTLITAVAPLPSNLWTIFYMDRLGRKFFLG